MNYKLHDFLMQNEIDPREILKYLREATENNLELAETTDEQYEQLERSFEVIELFWTNYLK